MIATQPTIFQFHKGTIKTNMCKKFNKNAKISIP